MNEHELLARAAYEILDNGQIELCSPHHGMKGEVDALRLGVHFSVAK